MLCYHMVNFICRFYQPEKYECENKKYNRSQEIKKLCTIHCNKTEIVCRNRNFCDTFQKRRKCFEIELIYVNFSIFEKQAKSPVF